MSNIAEKGVLLIKIRNWNETFFSYGVKSSMTYIVKYLLKKYLHL